MIILLCQVFVFILQTVVPVFYLLVIERFLFSYLDIRQALLVIIRDINHILMAGQY